MSQPLHSPSRPLWKQLLLRRLKLLLGLVIIVGVLGGGTYLLAPQWLMRLYVWQQASSAGLSTRGVQIGRTHWVYYEGGKGPTIVLLHGYGGNRKLWLKMAGHLTDHFHLIIPDLPGWGDSTRLPDASYGIDAQARRLAAFVHTLELRPFVLVGHSMGGAIAGVYAAAHPDRVAGLVLMDSFGLSSQPNAFDQRAEAGHNPFVYDSRAGFHRMERLVFAHPPHLPGRFVDVLVRRNRADHAFLQKVFHELSQPGQYDALDKRLPQLTMPVTAVWCRDDKVTDISALNTLRAGLTHAPSIGVTVINRCDHMPELEQPKQTARIIQSFALSH